MMRCGAAGATPGLVLLGMRPEPARFPPSQFPDQARGGSGGWGSCGGELGFRDLVRSVLADRFIAPIWWRISWASKARDWPRAVRMYRKALRRVPDAAEVWVQYGHALNETGDITGAAAAYRRGVGSLRKWPSGTCFSDRRWRGRDGWTKPAPCCCGPSSSIRPCCGRNRRSWWRAVTRWKKLPRTGGR